MAGDGAIQKAAAEGRIPKDISLAYLAESRDKPAIIAIICVTVLTCAVVAARCATRVVVVQHFGLDDGLAAFSMCLLLAFTILCLWLVTIGSGRHHEYIQHVMTLGTVEHSEVLDFAAHLLYTIALLICRLSGLAFYQRLCNMHPRFSRSIIIMAIVLIATFLPQIFLVIFHCRPVTGLWPYDWQPHSEEYTCHPWGVVYSVNSALSLLSDFLLFGIPIAMLWTLEMPRKRKIQLACILLPGLLVIGISVARLVLVAEGQWLSDQSWSYNPLLSIEVSEIGSTLIALSVPGLKPLFDKLFVQKRSGYTSSQLSSSVGSQSQLGTDHDRTAPPSMYQTQSHRRLISDANRSWQHHHSREIVRFSENEMTP